MNNTVESIQKDIANDFVLADLLSELIQDNVDAVAEEVVSEWLQDSIKYLDSAKVGCYEVWVNRLCGMLSAKDRDYLLQLLQQQENKLETR